MIPISPFKVRVTPKAFKNALKIQAGIIRIWVTATPESGKANEAVIQLLSKQFKIAKSRFTILKGETSRDKLLRID